MSDDPSNAELGRRLDEILRQLGGVVGHPEYAADKQGFDFRLKALQDQIAEERRDRTAALERERDERVSADKAVNDRITDQANAGVQHRQHWRSLLWQGALPAFVALVGVVAALWIAYHSGGSSH